MLLSYIYIRLQMEKSVNKREGKFTGLTIFPH